MDVDVDGLHDADDGVDPGGELNMIALGLDKGCLVDQLVNSVLQILLEYLYFLRRSMSPILWLKLLL